MSDVATWQARDPVRTLTSGFAEWDPTRRAWTALRHARSATFRHDGKVSDVEHHNPNGSIARSKHLYDADGRLTEMQSWMDDGPRMRTIFSYDTRGRPERTVHVAADGTRRDAETYRYDTTGRKTKLTFLEAPRSGIGTGYAIEGSEQFYGAPDAVTSTVTYDERVLPVETLFHDAQHNLVRRVTLGRDREGRLLTEDVHLGGNTVFPDLQKTLEDASAEDRAKLEMLLASVFADRTFASATYAYDQKGRLLERTRRIGQLSEERTIFRYDDHDNPIEEITEDHSRRMDMDNGGNVRATEEPSREQRIRFEYRYDAQGNWTERVVWSRTASSPEYQRSNVERRTITYYAGWALIRSAAPEAD